MKWRSGFLLALLFAWTVPARAQDPSGKTPKPLTPEERKDEEESRLVRELLTSGDEAEDLAWLYSRADEYAPSGLTGEPIPAPSLPERGEGSPRRWDPRWRKFGVGNYVLTGVGFGISAASSFVPLSQQPWRRTNELDEWGRNSLGVQTYESGQWAQDLSDVLLSLTLSYPLLVDSLVVGYWYRRSPEVAGQTALISIEAIAVASMLQGSVSAWSERERPYGRDCGKTIPGQLSECADSVRYRSFFSGHTSMSFAAAAVSCSHHARHDVFGDPLADGVSCGAVLGSATTVGLMRVVALKHYITDVLTGAAVGTLSGLGVPWLLHYGPLARVEPAADSSFTWGLYPLVEGVAVRGTF